jgi:hypothetical protein
MPLAGNQNAVTEMWRLTVVIFCEAENLAIAGIPINYSFDEPVRDSIQVKTRPFLVAAIGVSAMMFACGAAGGGGDLPDVMPAPPAKPATEELLAAVPRVPTPRPEASEHMPTPDVGDVMPADEKACRTRLTVLKVEFSELPRIEGEGQCGIAFPIEVTSLGSGIELTPAGVMNCATAETAAQLVLEAIGPAAERELGSDLAGIRHASAYICRNRSSESKISEHARGNALDISAFLLEDGRTVDVVGYGPANKPERRFMHTVRSAACGPFKTVLGPGTDADHAEHFHLDLAQRRRGSTYCR